MDSEERPKGGWFIVLSAALVMLATLPGRTQGLSLVTEPLISELHFSHTTFATINLWASLIGALFCFPAGWIFDRFGLRAPTAILIWLLAIVVVGISRASESVLAMFALLTLTRGLGQSALSVASITAMGKRFGKENGMPMAVFAVLISVTFAIAFGLIGWAIEKQGWRAAWLYVAIGLVALAPVSFTLRIKSRSAQTETNESGFELADALKTSAFWIFAGAAALFNFVSSGFGLFNEAILLERGFPQRAFHIFLGITTLISLFGQFAGGILSRKMSHQTIIALALALYAFGLLAVPFVHVDWQLYGVAVLIGLAAGMIIVVFFAIWPVAFGKRRLGRIQGAAQFLTVISSAVGPVVFAKAHEGASSYAPLLFAIAATVFVVGAIAFRAKLPALPNRPA